MFVNQNIALCSATASRAEQPAASLSVAQRHCFDLPYVNWLLHGCFYTITVQHINMSSLFPVPSCFRAFEPCDFPPKTSVDDMATQLENTGVTNPVRCRTKLAPYIINVRERSARAAIAAQFTLCASDELDVLSPPPQRGLMDDDAKHGYVLLNIQTQRYSNDPLRLFAQAPVPPPPKQQNFPTPLYKPGNVRLKRPDKIDEIFVTTLSSTVLL